MSLEKCSDSFWSFMLEAFPLLLTLHAGNFFMLLLLVCLLIKIIFFHIILSRTLWEFQTVGFQIRNDILSVLMWVLTVCKGYRQTTRVIASRKRVNPLYAWASFHRLVPFEFKCLAKNVFITKAITCKIVSGPAVNPLARIFLLVDLQTLLL